MIIHFTPELNFRAGLNGEHSIQIRCTHNRKHKRITTGLYIPKEHWDTKKYCIKKKHPLSNQYNRIIQQELLKFQKVYATFLEEDKEICLDAIISNLKKPSSLSFYDFAKQSKLQDFQNNKKLGTYRRYISVLEKVKDYAGSNLTLKSINYNFIKGFENHCLNTCKNGRDTVSANLSVIRSILSEAIRRGHYTERNPFDQVHLKYTDNTKAKLTIAEFKRFEQCVLPAYNSLQLAKDFFLACFYAGGCRGGDMVTMKHENVSNGLLTYQQQKTGSKITIPICDQLQKIIARNQNKSPYLFPIIKEGEDVDEIIVNSRLTYVNKYLKEVCKYSGILKKITTHCARHTFTDIALAYTNENIFGVKDVLGHSSVKVTELYTRGRVNNQTLSMVKDIYKMIG